MRALTELNGGRKAQLRPLEGHDRERLRRTFDGLSPESRYRRFFLPMPELSDDQLDSLVAVDHRDHEAIAAIEPSSGEIVGVARYVRSRSSPVRAEAAVAVLDDWQRQGLGRVLLEELAERAQEQQITCFTAMVQADNPRAVAVLSELGATTSTQSGDLVELTIELSNDGLSAPLVAALRAAASSMLNIAPLTERILRSVRLKSSGDRNSAVAPRVP